MTPRSTSARQRTVDDRAAARVTQLLELAPRGLATAYLPDGPGFAQTVRGVTGPDGVRLQAEGINLRYAAMAALGLARLPLERQREVLGGRTAADVASATAEQVADSTDPGAVALAVWAARRSTARSRTSSSAGWSPGLAGTDPLATVDTSWMVTAAVVAPGSAAPTPSWRRRSRGCWHTAASTGSSRTCCRRSRRPAGAPTSAASPTRSTRCRRSPAPRRHRRRADLLETANRTAARICDAAGRARPVVVALRLPRRPVVERLPRLQRPPARDGADGAVRPARGRWRRPPRRDRARASAGSTPTRRWSRSWSPSGGAWSGARSVAASRRKAARAVNAAHHLGAAGRCTCPASTGCSRRVVSTTSAGPTSSAGCSTPGCRSEATPEPWLRRTRHTRDRSALRPRASTPSTLPEVGRPGASDALVATTRGC